MNKMIKPAAIRGRYSKDGIAQRLELRPDMYTNTITSVQKDNVLIERLMWGGNRVIETDSPVYIGNVNPSGRGMNGSVYDSASISPTLTTNKGEGIKFKMSNTDNQNSNIRVRKLTPKECFRLMGFDDSDFEKARTAMNENIYNGNDRSSSQLYKQAGNSIVVDVLLHIMENLYDVMPYLFEDITVGSFFSGIGAFEKAMTRLDTDREPYDSDKQENVELKQIGYISDSNSQANRVYEPILARALNAEAGGSGAKTGWYSTATPKVIIDDTMGFEEAARYYEDACPSLRATRSGLKTVTGVIDPQGRKSKVNTPKDVAPTLRAQIHGNPPCAVYEVSNE